MIQLNVQSSPSVGMNVRSDKAVGMTAENVRLLKGEDGKTPVKGVDYFTEEDKTELLTDPSLYGLVKLEGHGPGSQNPILWIRSNNGQIQAYADVSSVLHIAGSVAFDNTLQLPKGLFFPSYGEPLTGNATPLQGFSSAQFNSGTTNFVLTGCNFAGWPGEENQNFIVKNQHITSGGGNDKNWAYQAYVLDNETGRWVRVFGVRADGTIFTNGKKVIGSQSTVVKLDSAKWSQQDNGRYTQTAMVDFMTVDAPVVSVDLFFSGEDVDADDAMESAYVGNVYRMTQGDGSVTFWAKSIPDVNIQVSVGVS